MRRKTRPRVVWLPGTNANSVGASPSTNHVQNFFVVTTAPPTIGDTATGEIPLVIDSEDDPLGASTSLSDVENSGYRLRRVVGKIFVTYLQDVQSPERIIVTAGIIVRRSNPVTGTSFAASTLDEELLNAQKIRNDGDPWVWRRSWILKTTFDTDLAVEGHTNYSFNAGSVADGPHVDAKTARIVSSEERLFLDVSVLVLDTNGGVAQNGANVLVNADLRVLASMRNSSGNRRNASR